MPVQCPECARFLSNAFVAGLQKKPAPCPKCETELRPEHFDEDDLPGDSGPTAHDVAAEPAAVPTPSSDLDGSVRPPDLPPLDVRGDRPDPLADWDRGLRDDLSEPTPTGVAIGIGAAIGGLLGVALADRPLRGAVLGGAFGAVLGAAGAQRAARRHQVDLLE